VICLTFLTYERLAIAKRCLESVGKNLKCSEELWLHIADDGSSQEYRDELLDLAHQYYGDNVSATNSDRRGYGGNYNAATAITHRIADLILPLEDDWEMQREFDLTPIANVLRAGLFGCVRMGYIGYTGELRATFRWAENMHWLELDPESSEPHVFSGGPRLETVEWERAVGLWPEGLEQGKTEMDIAWRPASKYKVAWPVELIRPSIGDVFSHIGGEKASIEGLRTAVPA